MNKFLDEVLYDLCKTTNLNTAEDVQNLINQLYEICDNKWKESLASCTGEEFKININRVFNSWNFMVNKLIKENDAMGYLLKVYSYKSEFMKNEKLKSIYEKY